MALPPNTKLGYYEILEAIGAGGMGEVYRARDTKLGREVAIKVLPEELSRDRERRARFEREAKLLAALNHPCIATLHGLEESEGRQFLVMELVEGETLGERLARGRMSVDEATPLFIRIAEGLEAAHEKGIIHRDLKPANIKIGPDGTPKILDFGLAKALMGTKEDERMPADASQSPTLTKGTALGVIMGTAAYMSPEQARGRDLDQRTDVWAFGCCLYEAQTGKPTFTGDTVPDTLTEVLGKEPDWDALPKDTPSRLRLLLFRMLRKDARLRLQHVGDARIELLDTPAEPSDDAPTTSKSRYGATFAAGFAAALLTGLAVWRLVIPSVASDAPVVRMILSPPGGDRLVFSAARERGHLPPIAVSRDGQTLAFVARGDGPARIYLRELGSLESRALDGTENAELPFFSYDGRWVGFLVGDVLWRVSTEGGTPLTIGKVPRSARGAAWLPNGSIVVGGDNRGLLRIDTESGTLEVLTQPDSARGEQYHAWPQVLLGGGHVLFTAVTGSGAGSNLGVLSLESNEWRLLEQTAGAAQPHYLESGHLVFFRPGGLFVAPFSVAQMMLEGSPTQVAEGVVEGFNAGVNLGFFAVSVTGVLAFVPGNVNTEENHVMRVHRSGSAEIVSEPGRYGFGLALSPDGQRLAVAARVRTSSDLWVLDLERGSRSRLTSIHSNISPVWTADGKRVVFSFFGTGGSFDLYSLRADGSIPDPLLEQANDQAPTSARRDGSLVVFQETHPQSREDIHILPLDGSTDPYPFLATSYNEQEAVFSPDGRFLAYASDETGRFEIYVQALSGDGGKIAISTDGGKWPRWSPKGDELFYRLGTAMMVVSVELEPSFRPGTPELLFDGPYAEEFDVFPDGEHFAMLSLPEVDLREITVVVNWFSELAQIVPVP